MIKRDQFVAGLKPTLRLKVELKNVDNFEDVIKVAKEKEWNSKRLTQLGVPKEPKSVMNYAKTAKAYAENEPVSTPVQEDSLKELHEAVELMRSLNLSMKLIQEEGENI